VSYDFVNDIENYEEAVEVFDFDAHASTKNRQVSTCRFFIHCESNGISSRFSVHIIKGGRAAFVSHHTFRCVSKSFRNDDIQHFVLMIYNSYGIDDIHTYGVMR